MTKKIVGILTMHGVVNYGSVLQAYATQKIVEKLGCDCEIIDYKFPKNHLPRRFENPVLSFLYDVYHFFRCRRFYELKNKLYCFRREYLHLSKVYATREEIIRNPPFYDIYLVGSDQVWNPVHTGGDDVFMLGFVPSGTCKISFSSSFAIEKLPLEYKAEYKRLLGEFKALSVRESNGSSLIKELLGRDVTVTLDPTLMLSAIDWHGLSISVPNKFKEKKYILLYLLNYAFNPAPYVYGLVSYLQNRTGYMVYTLLPLAKGNGIRNVKEIRSASPIEFLQLFESASYVVTSSFHGTAFAVNFGIPLYSVVSESDNGDDRQSSFLKLVSLEQCIVKKNTPFQKCGDGHYNKEIVRLKLDLLRKTSLSYLEQAIGKCDK